MLDGLVLAELTPEDKAFLERFKDCRYLSLKNCRLRSLANFPVLPGLTRLDLSDNHLEGSKKDLLAPLPACFRQLTRLSLSGNRLDLEAMKSNLIKLSETLSKLEVFGNPLPANYRELLFDSVASLETVDGYDRDGQIVDYKDSE